MLAYSRSGAHWVAEALAAMGSPAWPRIVPPVATLLVRCRGDGMFMVFDSVRNCGIFALRLAKGIGAQDWSKKGLPPSTSIRVAVHAGPWLTYFAPDKIIRRGKEDRRQRRRHTDRAVRARERGCDRDENERHREMGGWTTRWNGKGIGRDAIGVGRARPRATHRSRRVRGHRPMHRHLRPHHQTQELHRLPRQPRSPPRAGHTAGRGPWTPALVPQLLCSCDSLMP